MMTLTQSATMMAKTNTASINEVHEADMADQYELTVSLQQCLGALDRVLGALTHRGLLPQQMQMTADSDAQTMHLSLQVACPDPAVMNKLAQFLAKQITVLSVQCHKKEALHPVAYSAVNSIVQSLAASFCNTQSLPAQAAAFSSRP